MKKRREAMIRDTSAFHDAGESIIDHKDLMAQLATKHKIIPKNDSRRFTPAHNQSIIKLLPTTELFQL